MSIFRLLHITDLHVAIPPEDNTYGQRIAWWSREKVYPSRGNRYALEAVAEFLSDHRDDLDLVLVSGDVADDGVQRNLNAAYRYIATPATDGWFTRPFAPTLDAERISGPPFIVIPGNHDRFRTGRLPGGTAFDETFGSYWTNGIGAVQTFSLPKDGGVLAVISADFCLRNARTGLVFFGQGYAYKDTIAELVKQTAAIRGVNPNIGVIWISHFPPLLECELSLKLLNGKRLLNAARENSVKYIVAGHLHRNQVNAYADVDVICTGTASCMGAEELDGYWLQRLDVDVRPNGDLSIEIVRFQYKHAESSFVLQS